MKFMEMPEIFYEEMFDNIMKSFKKLFLLCAAVMLLATPGWAAVTVSPDITSSDYFGGTAPFTSSDTTYTLSQAWTITSADSIVIYGSGDITIDGGGKTLTASGDRAFVVSGDASGDLKVTIQDITIAASTDLGATGGISVVNASIILKNVVFDSNIASDDGGALKALFTVSADASNTNVTGGVYVVSVDNVVFSGDVASTDNGGAVSLIVSGDAKVSADIHNATFIGNKASGDIRGGGLYVLVSSDASADATVNVVNSTFTGNIGHGAYFGGNRAIKAHIVNSTFVNNSADLGSELYIESVSKDWASADIRIVNTILLNDQTTTSGDYFVISGDCSADVKIVKSFFDPKALSGDLTSADVISGDLSADVAPGDWKIASIDVASMDKYGFKTVKTKESLSNDKIKHSYFEPLEIAALSGAGAKTFDGVYKSGIAAPTDDIIGQTRDATITVGAYELNPKNTETQNTYSIIASGDQVSGDKLAATSGDVFNVKFSLSGDVTVSVDWSASGSFDTLGLTFSSADQKLTGTAKEGTGNIVVTAVLSDDAKTTVSKDFKIEITTSTNTGGNPNPTPTPTGATFKVTAISPDKLPDGTVSTDYSVTLTAITSPDSTAARKWTATGLPTGLSLGETDGKITGKPTAAVASQKVTVTVVVSGDTLSKDYTLTVKAATDTTTDPTKKPTTDDQTGGGTTTPTYDSSTGTIDVPSGTNVSAVITLISGKTGVVLTATNISNMSGLTTSTLLNLLTCATFKSVDLTTVKVAAIDLSGAKIESLTMAGNTTITSLVLSTTSNIPVIKANGTKIATVNLAGNTNIKDLDLSSTDISALDLTGCTNVTDLAVAEAGKLESLKGLKSAKANLKNLNIQKCSIIMLNLNGFTQLKATNAKLGGQKRSGFRAPKKFNWLTDFFFGSWSGQPDTGDDAADKNLDFATLVTITTAMDSAGNVMSEDVTASGDVTFPNAPTQFAYVFNTGVSASTAEELQAADDNAMDVAITATADDSGNTDPGSSGGGCDTGFGLLAVSACVALFINRKKH